MAATPEIPTDCDESVAVLGDSFFKGEQYFVPTESLNDSVPGTRHATEDRPLTVLEVVGQVKKNCESEYIVVEMGEGIAIFPVDHPVAGWRAKR